MAEVPQLFASLLTEVQMLCRAAAARQDEAAEALGFVDREIAALGAFCGDEPFSLPQVDRHLAPSLALAKEPPCETLASALAGCLPYLGWWDTEGLYGAYPEHEHFVENYAFTLIAGGNFKGRQCPYTSKTLYVGFTIQGSNTFYPGHFHEAVEIYMPVAGRAEWFRESDDWRTRAPGEFILHQPNEDHAMRTGGEPLLALFAWVSDLHSDVFLTAT